MRGFLFSLLLLLGSLASAKDTSALFEALRDSGEKYEITGTVCEQVARLNMQAQYPEAQYEVQTGVIYDNAQRTLGELDVVVFDKKDMNAILVAEVKCWKKLSAARSKAQEQRNRFIRTLNSGTNLSMHCDLHDCPYSERNFQKNIKYVAISQNGGEKAGFEMTLGYSLDELMRLREQLINCQKQNECARPQ